MGWKRTSLFRTVLACTKHGSFLVISRERSAKNRKEKNIALPGMISISSSLAQQPMCCPKVLAKKVVRLRIVVVFDIDTVHS